MSDDPSILEMENSPETANYRKNRLMLWEKLIAAYKDYIADAKKAGATEEQAARAAGKSVRGEIRVLCSDLLTRAPVEAIVKFIENARDWTDETEKLITDPKANAAMVELIQSSYPHRTWAKKIDVVTRQIADDAASWSGWVKAWGEEIGAVASGIATGVGKAAAGAGEALGAFGSGLARLIEWAPVIIGGTLAVGVVALVVRK